MGIAGETVTFYVKTINNANAPITGNGENIVTNPSGVTCADFSLVQARTSTNGGAWSPWYTPVFSITNWYTVDFAYGPTPITWSAGQVDITQIEVTFEAAASGTYTFTSQVVP